MSRLSILLLQGDAEARLLGQGGATLQACFPDTDVQYTAAWTTRSDLLVTGSPPPPAALLRRSLVPEQRVDELLQQPHDVVLLSLLADVALPVLRDRDGGAFVPHAGLVERWTPEDRALLDAECVNGGLLDMAESATALETVIEQQQSLGTAVVLCNVFRHVGEAIEHRLRSGTRSLRERIRAANLEVARLSHRTGCFVLDIDRALAHVGGAELSADCFGGGSRAEELVLEELLALVMDAVPSLVGGGA